MYWQRSWTVQYNGSGNSSAQVEFRTEGGVSRQFTLPWSGFVRNPRGDTVNFSARSADGVLVWLSLNRDYQLVGGGFTSETDEADQLRCGSAMDNTPQVEARQFELSCPNYLDQEAPASTSSWTFNTRLYPWVGEDGQAYPAWSITPSADGRDLEVIDYLGGQNTGTTYRFRDGRLIEHLSPRSRNGGPPHDCRAR